MVSTILFMILDAVGMYTEKIFRHNQRAVCSTETATNSTFHIATHYAFTVYTGVASGLINILGTITLMIAFFVFRASLIKLLKPSANDPSSSSSKSSNEAPKTPGKTQKRTN
ncbi:unnamed protein product, partial [Mesorhabditis belari]|uniref:Uncharacterized protein n=1 Tax=Mesorhabditis belari TaxID=2138241 RepID=A0AAF3FRM1_9BILA